MTWEHKGYTIKVHEISGDFIAVGHNGAISGPSLATVKSKIDKLVAFESFDAITLTYGEIKEHRVVGVTRARGRHSYGQWKTSTDAELAVVIRDTPENRAAVTAFIALNNKTQEEVDRLRGLVRDAHNALPQERPPA